MSNLYYSSPSVNDIYNYNTTTFDNNDNLILTDPILSINCSEQVILNNHVSENINNIKNELLTDLLNNNIGDFPIDSDIINFIDNSSNVISKYKIEQKKMIEYETLYQTELNNTNNSVKSLLSYSNIAKNLENEYINSSESKQNIDTILDNINIIVDKMKDNTKLTEAKNNYMNSRKKMLSYIEFVKFINKDNLGSTCSLCFSNQVNHYMNPCGHTLCGSCKTNLNIKNYDNCVFCRKQIVSINSLYFI